MKVGPSTHYSVGVWPEEWNVPTPNARLYRGIYAVELQHHVDINFVPDISSLAPPWDQRMLPDDIDTIETAELARLTTALLSSYVVTPNADLTGIQDQFDRSPPPGLEDMESYGVVFYVTAEEFTRYVADLDEIKEVASGLHVRPLVDDLRDREVIAFIEQRIVASPLLRPHHAEMLGQAR